MSSICFPLSPPSPYHHQSGKEAGDQSAEHVHHLKISHLTSVNTENQNTECFNWAQSEEATKRAANRREDRKAGGRREDMGSGHSSVRDQCDERGLKSFQHHQTLAWGAHYPSLLDWAVGREVPAMASQS